MYNKGGLFNYQFQQLLNIKAIFSILEFHFLAYKFLLFIIYELNSVRHCFSLLLTRSLHRTSSSLFLVHQLQFRFLAVRQTLPKAQRTRGLSSSFQNNFLKSYLQKQEQFHSDLHHVALSFTIFHYLALTCTNLHHIAPCCTMLHHVAPCCTMLHHDAPS